MDEEGNQGRLHSNSTASQVSSVGFNTLKRLNTNSSVSTNNSTTSTKPNALSRLFTRNKSNTTLALDEPNLSDGESDKLVLERKPSNVFRLTNKINKRRGKNNKDLTVQTEGLNVPTPPPSINKKGSVNSPVSTLHNLFHRSSTSTSIASATYESIEESIPRTTITLSSQNSNSTITDANFAQVYRFTDSSHLAEDDYEDNEGFKKIFLPADQFLKPKLPNSPISLGDDNEDSKFWNALMALMKPVILSSQQKKLANGFKGHQMIMTEEDISNFIKENYVAKLNNDDDSVDIKSREVIQDLTGFFNRVVSLFHRDFKPAASIPDSLDPLCKAWIILGEEWLYFRDHIMYFILNSFVSVSNHTIVVRTCIDIEKLLLNSFKDIIVEPFIDARNNSNQKDRNFLLNYKDGGLLRNIVQCFGLLNATQAYDTNDDKSLTFLHFFVWITEL